MPDEQSTGPDLVAEIAALLGGKSDGKPNDQGSDKSNGKGKQATSLVTSASLKKATQQQLVEAAKKLGLSPPPKIKKDALAKLVLEAWQALVTSLEVEVAVPAADADHTALTHKFEVGQPGRADSDQARQILRGSSKEIPWGYGRDRVTAMPIDPDRLFAYWEVLDESIARARAQLGRGGAGAWLNLRVYDITARIFDGTNAHGTLDHRVERGDRQWFFPIGKPTSELIVEIGLKSDEGYFVKIARSGRVEFPRREPTPPTEPEWLTVRVATGQVERGGVRVPQPSSPIPATPAPGLGRVPIGPGHRPAWDDVVRVATGGADRHEWEEIHVDGAIEAERRFRWEEPATITSWEAGPFPYPVEVPEPVREAFAGKTRVFRLGGRTHVVYGPWQVVIKGLQAEQSRVVLSRWEVYRSWAEITGHEVQEFGTTFRGGTTAGASERMVGSSDRRWVGGSEVRLRGSSEVYFLKASESRLGGASERRYAGASETVMRGSSERNQRRFMGASDNAYPAARAVEGVAGRDNDGAGSSRKGS